MNSMYEQLKSADVKLDNHYSDLYAAKNETSQGILKGYEYRDSVTEFTSPIDGEIWYDIPFCFDPFWREIRR
jgi:hypothetical protein